MSLCQIIQPFPLCRHVNPLVHQVAVLLVILMKQTMRQAHTLQQSVSNQGKRKNAQWMDTKYIFGRDVANSIRAIKSEDLQHCAKFVVQTAIFQTTEHASLQHLQIYIPALTHMRAMALIAITFSLLLVS